ncbi:MULTISPECIES: glycosyltransferase family 4 protein [Bacteroides]|jgi:glycosyltransferase involved in cell wall biosynthesis|uniref:glycosyltransferase family 4 protein n=1 Tax=Bacteroides TaxID=816 RepID=UPI000E4C7E80|nr:MULTISPECIES: glycosyltransferase family 4 protein [Bacteroides]RHL05877.1 glycosyltransferase family 1 protein [Bacteroides sp. AF39-11AC]
MYKIIRLTTISGSLYYLLKGQLRFLSKYYEIIGVGSDFNTGKLREVSDREGVRCIDIPMYREISLLNDMRSLIKLIKLFKKEQPYIVHANTPKASLLSMIAAWIIRVPHRIYTVTGLRFETATKKIRWLLIIMEKITCWCATKVIPEGEGVKKMLITNGITKKPLKVILNGNINGIDVEYFSRSAEVMYKVETIKEGGTFNFVFVGRIVKDKGINELVRAFSKLIYIYPEIRLHLVGSFERELDPLDENVERMIRENEAIIIWGFQPDIRSFLAASDVFVFPSYREGFPNVVLQAGAMELPSIVTDINGCNEIIQDGVNGRIIPPKDEEALYEAMKWMYEHREMEVKKMIPYTRPMIVERYEQKKLWEALLEEYNSLL